MRSLARAFARLAKPLWPWAIPIVCLLVVGMAASCWAQSADVDMGAELAEPAARGSLRSSLVLRLFRDGGALMYPIALCSVVLLVFVFERSISLRRSRVIPKPFVARLLHQLQEQQLDAHEALQRCEENASPIAQVFAAAVKKWNRSSVEVEQAVLDSGERVAHQLRRYLRLFNGVSTISPLLGLLGTVVGMIRSFDVIAQADALGRPELLAGGIGQALITTAAGLVVAIPALIAYLYFTSRVDRLIVEIDRLGQQVVAAIAADGWKEGARRGSASSKSPSKAA